MDSWIIFIILIEYLSIIKGSDDKMSTTNNWVNEAWEQVVEKVGKTSKRIGATFPHVSIDGKYNNERVGWWTAGFWPGILWLVYRETKDNDLRDIAISIEEKLDEPLYEFTGIHHDVGFMWIPSAIAHYKLLGNEESKRRGLIAASHLAGRFNIKGNFIRAWTDKVYPNGQGVAIIDCMMNLPLLYWASEETGDPRFKHIAMAHADTADREFIRKDGSVHHIVRFDPETGERIEALAGQGYAPDSAWSRGVAWAIYGMALSYRYTKEPRYLEAAKRAAHFFLANLPEDQMPYWDFRAPVEEDMAYDSSAAACAASGLLELARWVEPNETRMYEETGTRIIKSLYENYGAWDEEEEALIKKGTVNRNTNKYVNTPIIYGDYFFVEALAKLRGQKDLFW